MKPDYRIFWESAGGCVPAHWSFVPIADLLETPKSMSVGVMYPGPDTPGGVPLVRVSDVKDGAVSQCPEFCVSHEVDEEYRRSRFNGTELLITLVGNPGDCAIVSEEMTGWNAARALAVVRLKDPALRPWLRYVLLSKPAKHLIDARLNTTVQKTLNLKDIKELAVPIPPQNERDKITDIIGGLEKKIVLNRQINQTLEQIAQTIFKSWFVDFEPVKAKIEAKAAGRYPERAAMCAISGRLEHELDQLNPEKRQQLAATAALFPDELVESELGLIPVGWEVKAVSDISKFASGKINVSTINIENYISTENMSENRGGVSFATSIPTVATVPSFSKGQVLISNIRPYFKKIWFARFDGGRSNDVLAFDSTEKNCTEFLYNLLYQDEFFEFMMRTSKGAKMPRGDKDAIAGWRFACADRSLRSFFSEKVRSYYSYIKSLNAETQQLSQIRDNLLPKLLFGDLEVLGCSEAMELRA